MAADRQRGNLCRRPKLSRGRGPRSLAWALPVLAALTLARAVAPLSGARRPLSSPLIEEIAQSAPESTKTSRRSATSPGAGLVRAEPAGAVAAPLAALLEVFHLGVNGTADAAAAASGTKVASWSGQKVSAPLVVYPVTFLVFVGMIFLMYWPKGPWLMVNVASYLIALSTMRLSVKTVFLHHGFNFPKFVTALHFLTGALVCACVLLRRKIVSGGHLIPVPTRWQLFLILPIAAFSSMSIGCTNTALVFSSTAFVEVISSTGCLITIGIVLLMGLPFNPWLVFPCLLVTAGCMVATVGEIQFSVLALLLCFASNVFRSFKVTLQQRVMSGNNFEAFDPCTLLFWISIPSFIVTLTASMALEGSRPYVLLSSAAGRHVWMPILLSCVNAVVLNLAQLYITKSLGAVGSQMVAQSKTILTVLGSMTLFGEPVTHLEAVGFALVLFGVYTFTRFDNESRKK